LFPPLSRVESISDWFAMLPGCPRCDYAYQREPGYFLFALWMINFTLVAIFGVSLLLLLDYLFPNLSTAQLIFFTLVPLWVLGILSLAHQSQHMAWTLAEPAGRGVARTRDADP
jgi:hypothetical protein